MEEFKRDDMAERRDEDFFFLLRFEVVAVFDFVFLPFWLVFTVKRTFLRADKYVFEIGNGCCSCLMVESLLSFILSNWSSSSSSALLLSIMTLSLLISFN